MQNRSKHKMVLLTMLGAYPTIVLLLALIRPVLGTAPMPIQAAVLVPLMVVLLNYVVMPSLTRIFSGWLSSGRTSTVVTLTMIALCFSPASSFALEQTKDQTESAKSTALDEMVVDHVMINVSDFERSVKWYQEKLGFQETVRWTVDGLKDTNLAYLKRGSFLIELASGPTTEDTARLPRATDFASHFAQRGITHLCFKVRDVDAALAQLNQSGVPTFSPAIDFPALSCRVGFIQDPDGNVIEFKGPLSGTNVVNGKAIWKTNPGSQPGSNNRPGK